MICAWCARVASSVAVEGIVSAGKHLIAAKADVQHGEWLPLLEQIGIIDGYARKLMSTGHGFPNRSSWNDLPGGVAALYELSRLAPEAIESGIEHGDIHPANVNTDTGEVVEKFPSLQCESC